ncbi:hypothetical protein GY45DRAFT_138691 [Cubamyces sp. BRFM 1775]|nr:hypothetical protein GY45DRAFT_138691 [Cubamyces sp. BRFM 1775]
MCRDGERGSGRRRLVIHHLLPAVVLLQQAEEPHYIGILRARRWRQHAGQNAVQRRIKIRQYIVRKSDAVGRNSQRRGVWLRQKWDRLTSVSNWSPVPSKQSTNVRGAAGSGGGMMSLSPSSLEDECTLVGVVGRRWEYPLSEDVLLLAAGVRFGAARAEGELLFDE